MSEKTSIILAVLIVLFGVVLGLTKKEDKQYSYKM